MATNQSKLIYIPAPNPDNDCLYFTHRYIFATSEDSSLSTETEYVVRKVIYMNHIKSVEEYVEDKFSYKGDLITISMITGEEYVAEGSMKEFLKIFTDWLDKRKNETFKFNGN